MAGDPATPIGEARSIVFAISDMDAACRYYSEGLGLPLKCRDGNSWAARSRSTSRSSTWRLR
jgi:hypothetical protein